MNPIAMTVILVVALAALIFSLIRRWRLMLFAAAPEGPIDRIGERVCLTLKYAFGQRKLVDYPLAGGAHILVFAGFLLLLLRSLILWGRAFEPAFNFWVFGPDPVMGIALGHIYDLAKDVAVLVVLLGAGVFVFLRVVVKEKRMTLHWEGLVILAIIIVMMVMDSLYDGAMFALGWQMADGGCLSAGVSVSSECSSATDIIAPMGTANLEREVLWHAPLGSGIGLLLERVSIDVLVVLARLGFWTHCTLVLIFANILPYTKHFHIITSIPNVFLSNLEPAGRIRPIAAGSEALMELVANAADLEDPNEVKVGIGRAEHITWKGVLDLYSCTECGRCTDNCPASVTGKVLSPKQLTIGLRNHFYENEAEFVGSSNKRSPIDLVPGTVSLDEIWGCTTCRACEELCPVHVGHVNRMVEFRRNQVLVAGEVPSELTKVFSAMETNGNPWNLSREDRGEWARGLGVRTMAEKPDAEVLYWVGCAASYDDRAKRVARSFARLLMAAGVEFGVLGEEETCTGDAARRAGNEYLFALLAEQNVAVLNGYRESGGVKVIVATCPHCFNTLSREYGDFGGHYNVVHHSEFLLRLVREGKLVPKNEVKARVVFHDSCYLGRYAGMYEGVRELMRLVPGVQLVEPELFSKNRAFCCGAGGAQMWMEEQNTNRMSTHRVRQLMNVGGGPLGPQAAATACPFCMTMIADGLGELEDRGGCDGVRQLDIAEILAESCLGSGPNGKNV